jgi:hypothetical protein
MLDDREDLREPENRRSSNESAGSLDEELHAALGGDGADPGSDYYDDGGNDYDDDVPAYEQTQDQRQGQGAKSARSNDAVLGQASSSSQSDYTYFDQALGKNWAGPEHWRMRRIIQSMLGFSFSFFPPNMLNKHH